MAASATHVDPNLPKRKRIGKNKKKSWKNIDVTEVEEFLEDERLQERTGGLVAEKLDSQLFFVDKEVEEPDAESVPQKKKKSLKYLKCYAKLEPDPLIKPARIAHNIQRRTVLKKQTSKGISVTQLKAKKQRQESKKAKVERRKSKNKLPIAVFDLWADSSASTKRLEEVDHYMAVTKKRRVNVPSMYHKSTSGLSAVEVPHPGASYNPTFDDHQDLMSKAHEVEKKKLKAEKKLFNALEAKFPLKSETHTEETWLAEMGAGLGETNIVEEEDNANTDLGQLLVNPPVRREDFKTKKQKRKQKEQKHELKRAGEVKTKMQSENKIFRLKSIKKEIKQQETVFKKRTEKKEKQKKQSVYLPKRIGKQKYEEPDLELKLGYELRGSLRLLSPEGHLLEDRYKSLQKRNITEPRIRAKRKKTFKHKVLEKKTHKEIKI